MWWGLQYRILVSLWLMLASWSERLFQYHDVIENIVFEINLVQKDHQRVVFIYLSSQLNQCTITLYVEFSKSLTY